MRYIVCPGYVYSLTDGQRHYIKASQLVRLYRAANPSLVTAKNWVHRDATLHTHPSDVFLYPHSDGNYKLSDENEDD